MRQIGARWLATVACIACLVGCNADRDDTAAARSGSEAETTALDTSAVELRLATADDVLAAVRASDARVTLVNVWATWCMPCREEFPDLVRLERAYRDRGLRVLFVCADFDSEWPAAKKFLADHGVTYPSYFKTGDDMKFIDTLSPKWSGALPATIVFDASGTRRAFWEGKASYATFESKVNAVLEGRSLDDSTEVST